MVYVPTGRSFSVNMDFIRGKEVKAWWYNPRTGEATQIGRFPKAPSKEFVSPTKGEDLDWVLVLDDAAKNFAPPGKPGKST
jgi:hypothetical protein